MNARHNNNGGYLKVGNKIYFMVFSMHVATAELKGGIWELVRHNEHPLSQGANIILYRDVFATTRREFHRWQQWMQLPYVPQQEATKEFDISELTRKKVRAMFATYRTLLGQAALMTGDFDEYNGLIKRLDNYKHKAKHLISEKKKLAAGESIGNKWYEQYVNDVDPYDPHYWQYIEKRVQEALHKAFKDCEYEWDTSEEDACTDSQQTNN